MTAAQVVGKMEASGWAYHADMRLIQKAYDFPSFGDAIGFIVKGALLAEKRDHHPDWTVSSNVVQVRLTTHDAGGVTVRDCRLALELDGFADIRSRIGKAVRSSLAAKGRA